MKKRGQENKHDNIILFPGVEKRLIEKGLESLHNKQYRQAIDYLEEAKQHDPNNDDVLIGLVLAYFEAADFINAKMLAKEMLLKGAGDYFQLVELYLSILIQLHEYQEIVTTIEALMEEKEIPPEKYTHFFTILQFSRRMADNHPPELNTNESTEELPQPLDLLNGKSLDEQMFTVSKLADRNIRPFVPEIEAYLKTDTGHPFLKTMLLTLLREQEIDRPFIVTKFNLELEVNPIVLPEVRLQPRMVEVRTILANHLENNNPGLYENMIPFVDRIFFMSYPLELEPGSAAAWAAAFELLGMAYMGDTPEMSQVADEYGVLTEEVLLAANQIELIEKISYPDI